MGAVNTDPKPLRLRFIHLPIQDVSGYSMNIISKYRS